MLKLFELFTKEYYKRHFVILHIPTGQYVHVRRSVFDIADGFELASKPTYFYYVPWNKWHLTTGLDKIINNIDCYYAVPTDGNPEVFTFTPSKLDKSEFELVDVDRSQIK